MKDEYILEQNKMQQKFGDLFRVIILRRKKKIPNYGKFIAIQVNNQIRECYHSIKVQRNESYSRIHHHTTILQSKLKNNSQNMPRNPLKFQSILDQIIQNKQKIAAKRQKRINNTIFYSLDKLNHSRYQKLLLKQSLQLKRNDNIQKPNTFQEENALYLSKSKNQRNKIINSKQIKQVQQKDKQKQPKQSFVKRYFQQKYLNQSSQLAQKIIQNGNFVKGCILNDKK